MIGTGIESQPSIVGGDGTNSVFKYGHGFAAVVHTHKHDLGLGDLDPLVGIVTELYLADSPAKCKRLWARAAIMKALKIAPRLVDTIIAQDNPEALAAQLREWTKTGKG